VSSQARKHRGYGTQGLLAVYYQGQGWVYAESTGAGRQGADLTGTPGVTVEIKARKGFDPLAWLRQAKLNALHLLPYVVFRCNGQGPESIGSWGVLMTLDDHTRLLREAGYFPEAV
jgi:hypothetical protein